MKKELTQFIKQKSLELGFSHVGIARSHKIDPTKLDEWLNAGYHGEMGYLKERRDMRLDPSTLVPNAKSIVVLVTNYYTDYETTKEPDEGRISRYAWGDDYHEVIRPRLNNLLAEIQKIDPTINGRGFVDSAPVMEKYWAVQAGLGWQGKNSNIIIKGVGSFFFLSVLILDVELEYGEPFDKNFCGTCAKCIDACPTGAIIKPHVVNGSQCISYFTIELKADSPKPVENGEKFDNIIFGCDICQDVCPWNVKFSKPTNDLHFEPRPINQHQKLVDLKNMTLEQFRERYRKSPIKRAKHEGLMRNVHNALENFERKDEHG